MRFGGILDCSDHEMADVRMLRDSSRAKHRITALGQNITPLEICLEKSHGRQPWREKESRKAPGLQAQQWSLPRSRTREGRRLRGWARSSWLTREVSRRWKEGQMAQENYRNSVWLWKDGVRKAKAQLGLNMETHVNTNMEGFHKDICSETKTRENVPHWWSGREPWWKKRCGEAWRSQSPAPFLLYTLSIPGF